MNVLILNGSPKKRGGASRFISSFVRVLLCGCKVSTESLHKKNSFSEILKKLPCVDAVVLSVPLYVDGIPSHVLEFLEQAEAFCKENNCRFTLYVITNNGFIEGRQNSAHLDMYRCWCDHAGIKWGGGVGVGGGVMLHVISIAYPVTLAFYLLIILLNLISAKPVSADTWISLLENALIYVFLSIGFFYCMVQLARAVRKQETAPNRYTRVMVPSFLFIPMADIFMTLASLFHGRIVFTLLKKDHAASSQENTEMMQT